MITELVSYGAYTFGPNEDEAGLPWEGVQGQWSVVTRFQPILGTTGRIVGGEITPRRIDCEIVVDAENADFLDQLDAVRGALVLTDPTPRILVGRRHDGTLVESLATVEQRPALDDSVDTLFLTFVAADPVWRALTPTTSSLLDAFNPSFATDLAGWASVDTTSGLTVVVTRDPDIFFDAAGSQRVEITANTAGAGALTDRFNTAFLPVTAGQDYAISMAARRDTTDVTPQQTIAWFDSGQVFLSASAVDSFAPAVGDWERRTLDATAPVSAAFAQVVSRVLIPGAGNLGTVWFDDVHFNPVAKASSDADLAFTVGGSATVHPIVTLRPVANPTPSAPVPFSRTITIRNDTKGPLDTYAYRLDLGDTSGWAAGFLDASKFYVFRDGLQVPREPVNLDAAQSYCWILINGLAAGESAEYRLVYSDTGGLGLSDDPLELTGIGNRHRPAFDISWESNTATSGSSTTITRTGAGWQTNQWRHGLLEIIGGAGAGGDIYQVLTNDDDTLTINGTFANGTPDNTSVYLVSMSGVDPNTGHTWWVYDIRQVERSDPERGLWWTSGAGQSPPQEVRFDTPGSWYPVSLLDNNDERVQKEVTPFNPGGTTDYVAGLDCNRTWQGGSSYEKGARLHDGVAFDSPVPIVSLRADFLIKNPNGMAKGFLGAKEGAGADYEAGLEHTTASDTLTTIAPNTYTFPSGTHHLAIGLLPRNDTEIPLSWAEDSGTATSATSTTLSDATKAWVSGQWVNATILVVSGTGAGQARAVTASGPTSVTVATWTTTPDTTSRYQIRQKSNDATFRHETSPQFRLILDESDIVVSEALSAEQTNFLVIARVALDAEDIIHDPHAEIEVGILTGELAVNERRVFLGEGEELRIDGERRRVTVHDVTTGAVTRTLGHGFVRAIDYLGFDAAAGEPLRRLAADWLPMTPGAHEITVNLPNTTALLAAEVAWTDGYLS